MVDRPVNTRITVTNAREAAEALASFGREGERAFERLQRATRPATSALSAFDRGARRVGDTLFSLKGTIAALGLGAVGREVAQAQVAFERITNSLKAATGSATAAAGEYEFVRERARALGLDLEVTASQYARLAAAARGTALAGDETRNIFEAVSEASVVLGLSAEQTGGALTAVEQIISKGKVSAEELRGQLGERLPGAFQIAARAIGVTTAQLDDMLKKGELTAEDLLPKLAQELRRTFADQVPDAARSAQAEFNRFNTALFELKTEFADGGFMDGLIRATRQLTAFLGSEDTVANARAFSAALKDGFGFIVDNADTLLQVGSVLGGAAAGARVAGLPGAIAGGVGGGILAGRLGRLPELEREQGRLAELRGRPDADSPTVRRQILEVEQKIAVLRAEQLDNLLAEEDLEEGRLIRLAEQSAVRAEINAQAAKAREAARAAVIDEKERERALKEIAKLEERAQVAGLEGVARLTKERDLELARYKKRLDEKVITEEEYAAAVFALNAELVGEIAKLNNDVEEKRQREIKRVEEKIARERERAAEQAAEAMQKPFENAAERIQESFSDAIFDIVRNGKLNFEDLGGSIKNIMARTFAEIATLAIIRPVIAPVVQGIAGAVGLPGGAQNALAANLGLSALGGGGASGAAGGVSALNFASVGAGLVAGFQSQALGSFLANSALEAGLSTQTAAFLGNAGLNLGFGAIGSLGAGLLGLGSGNALVDAGLGTAGAFIGGGLGGPIGAVAGGFIGTSLGGLFAGGGGFRNAPLTEGFTGLTADGRLRITGVGAKGADVEAGRQFAQGGVDVINTLLASGAITNLTAAPRFDSKLGQFRTFLGPTPNNADTPAGGFLGLGTDAERVFIDTVKGLVNRGLAQAASPEILAAIQNSKASTVQAFGEDLDFAARIAGIDFNAEELTQTERALKAINDQFDEMRERALALGISEDKLVEARERAFADLATGFDLAVERSILAATDPARLALEDLERSQEQRREEAAALGADLVELERLFGIERERVLRASVSNVRNFLNGLTTTSSGPLSPANILVNAEARFASALSAAEGGDRSDLTAAAGALISALQTSFASSPQFFDRFNEIVAALEGFAGAGFATGGSFTVPGTFGGDNVVPLFRVGGGETVTVTPAVRPGESPSAAITAASERESELLRAILARFDGLERGIAALVAATRRQGADLARVAAR